MTIPGRGQHDSATWAGKQGFGTSVEHFKYVVFKAPNWNFRRFDFDKDFALADEVDNGLINALDPNLKAFFDRGGKLIQYHGWADPQISPGASVSFHKSVLSAMGGPAKVQASYRLFMVPGMRHCRGAMSPTRSTRLPRSKSGSRAGKRLTS